MRRIRGLTCGVLAACVLVGAAQAQPRHDQPRHEHYEHYEHMDGRYAHNHYYPSRGYVAPVLPRGYITVNHFHDHYYYAGGVWYRPYGGRFVVIAPPIGVFVPVLPPFYTTVWFGGVPYYYADNTYYAWRQSDNQYEVVAPPDGSGDSASTQAPPSDDVFIYPKNGQSEDQQSTDRYECHSWASGQSGFDPTKAGGGVAPQDANAKRADYNRAMTACLEGRGYSVK